MKRKWDYFKKNRKICILVSGVIIVLVILGGPIIINYAFSTPAPCKMLEVDWGVDDALNYYGTVLSFLGTTLLSIVALIQNERIKQMEMKRDFPLFVCLYEGCCSTGGFSFKLINANSNANFYGIEAYDCEINGEKINIHEGKVDKEYLSGNIPETIITFSSSMFNGGNLIKFKIKCYDVYQNKHIYEFTKDLDKQEKSCLIKKVQ